MDSLLKKLNSLERVVAHEKIDIKGLRSSEGYPLLNLRREDTKYGTSLLADVLSDGTIMTTLLPRRFLKELKTEELELINNGGFRIKCTGVNNGGVDVHIFRV